MEEDVSPLTPREAAKYLTDRGFPMSGRTVYRLVEQNLIDATRTPGNFARIKISELERYMEANR